MIVANSVDLPTPFRPRTVRVESAESVSETPSSTTVSPYPAETSASLSASAMTALAEIDLAHTGVGGDLRRRALDQHRALDHYGDRASEAEHQVHVVLDDQHGDAGGKTVDHLEDDGALVGRHACRRLVEQQHLGPQAQRDGDLDQALAAVGELFDQLRCVVGDA